MPVGKSIDDVAPLFHTMWPLEQCLPTNLKIHPATEAAWRGLLGTGTGDAKPLGFDIYPDGSFRNGLSTWAFAVLASWENGQSVCGLRVVMLP